MGCDYIQLMLWGKQSSVEAALMTERDQLKLREMVGNRQLGGKVHI